MISLSISCGFILALGSGLMLVRIILPYRTLVRLSSCSWAVWSEYWCMFLLKFSIQVGNDIVFPDSMNILTCSTIHTVTWTVTWDWYAIGKFLLRWVQTRVQCDRCSTQFDIDNYSITYSKFMVSTVNRYSDLQSKFSEQNCLLVA